MKLDADFIRTKFNFRPVFILSFLIFSLSLAACSEKKISEIIIGEWKVESVELPDMDLSPSLMDEFKNEMLSSVYTFKEEGKFNLKSGLIPDGANGIWRTKDEVNELFIEYTAGNNTLKGNYKIEVIDENKIKFIQSFGESGNMEAILVRN